MTAYTFTNTETGTTGTPRMMLIPASPSGEHPTGTVVIEGWKNEDSFSPKVYTGYTVVLLSATNATTGHGLTVIKNGGDGYVAGYSSVNNPGNVLGSYGVLTYTYKRV